MKGEKFVFSEQIKTHEHGTGMFLEYMDTDEGEGRGVLYVPLSSIKKHPLGQAIIVPTKTAFRLFNPSQQLRDKKPFHEDKFHRRWVHEMHDKWKNEEMSRRPSLEVK